MSHEGQVESTSREGLLLAIRLAFLEHREATHILSDEKNGCIVFFWHEPEKEWSAKKLYKPMSAEKVADYAWVWLQSYFKHEKRPETHADSINAGFHVKFGGEFRLSWTKYATASSAYGILAIYPVWHEVHK